MNTKHIAEETAEQIETDVSDVIIDKALLTGIIQSAIEKAIALHNYKLICTAARRTNESRAAHASEDDAEQLARTFHETYERLAPAFNYDTRKESAKPWEQVPDTNRKLMIAVCRELLSEPWRCKTKGGAAHTDVEQLRAECDHYKMLTQELGQELRAARASHYEIEAAKKLCELYFNIAAEVIGEDEVRKRRDAMIEFRAARESKRKEGMS